MISTILKVYDDVTNVSVPTGRHITSSIRNDTVVLMNDLIKYNLFKPSQTPRTVHGLPEPKSLIKCKPKQKLQEWIVDHVHSNFDC